jgi:hypothetical protein
LTRRYSYLTKSYWKPWGCCARCQVALVLNLVNFRNRLTQLRSCFRVVLSDVVLSNRLATSNSADLKTTCADNSRLATTTFSVAALLLRVTTAAAPLHCCFVPLLLRSALLCSTRFRHALLKICWEMRSHQAVSLAAGAVTQAKAPVVLIDTVRLEFFRCSSIFFAAALYYSYPKHAAKNPQMIARRSSCVAGCWRCDPSQGACGADRYRAPSIQSMLLLFLRR